ncbi:MAG: RagB/SusD family nutrient uptake outer membrane protein, partial [Prevotella sp.]|nr:RagB/SusD family nutrient uptake outer membrane protein [Prevotella sp.]
MKKHINNKFLYLLVLCLYILAGCDDFKLGDSFLEQPPELKYSLDSAFTHAERAREVLWNAYSTLPYGHGYGKDNESGQIGWIAYKSGIGTGNAYQVPIWCLTDLVRFRMTYGGIIEWMRGTISAQNAHEYAKYNWRNRLGWDGIRISHIFMDNVDKVMDMDDSEKRRLKAEAKIIIATHYVEMFHHYGGVPYVNKAFDPNDELTAERLTVLQTVDTICALIDNAIPDLPFTLEDPALWSGRLTSAAAMGLKVKFLLMAASPLFNSEQPYMDGEAATKQLVWTGGYKRDIWEKLRAACEELLTKLESQSYYKMVNTGNPALDYRAGYLERTSETLYSTRTVYRWVSPTQPDIIRNQHWWADCTPLHNYARMFPMKNGMSISNPASGYDPANPYYNRDPRLYEALLVNGGNYQSRKMELYEGGQDRITMRNVFADAGYKLFKWKLNLQTSEMKANQWPYFRIPDLYLIYAEALNELNNGPTAEAARYVNKVRERVQVGPIEDFIGKPLGQISKKEFLDALLNERVLELGCENSRWFDMVRHKMEDVFTSKDIAMDIYLKVPKEGFDIRQIDFSQHSEYFEYVETELTDGIRWQ